MKVFFSLSDARGGHSVTYRARAIHGHALNTQAEDWLEAA